MQPREWVFRVQHILDAIARIERYIDGMTADAFMVDSKTADAVVWNIGIIGEAAHHIPPDVRARYPAVPWNQMRAMRNLLIHDYPRIDLSIVWQTATENLPQLRPLMQRILEESC